jgi:hypothetical protein
MSTQRAGARVLVALDIGLRLVPGGGEAWLGVHLTVRRYDIVPDPHGPSICQREQMVLDAVSRGIETNNGGQLSADSEEGDF